MKLNQILEKPIGLFLLFLAVILNKYYASSREIDYLIGFLFGISIILNTYFIFAVIKKKSNKS